MQKFNQLPSARRIITNAVLLTSGIVVAAAVAFACAGKIEPERISNLDKQAITAQKTEPSPEEKEKWQPRTAEKGMKISDLFDACTARLQDGRLVALTMGVVKDPNTSEWDSNGLYKVIEIDPEKRIDSRAIMANLALLEFLRQQGIPAGEVGKDSCPPPNNKEAADLLEEFLANPDKFFKQYPSLYTYRQPSRGPLNLIIPQDSEPEKKNHIK